MWAAIGVHGPGGYERGRHSLLRGTHDCNGAGEAGEQWLRRP
jgi:hypothetical protein